MCVAHTHTAILCASRSIYYCLPFASKGVRWRSVGGFRCLAKPTPQVSVTNHFLDPQKQTHKLILHSPSCSAGMSMQSHTLSTKSERDDDRWPANPTNLFLNGAPTNKCVKYFDFGTAQIAVNTGKANALRQSKWQCFSGQSEGIFCTFDKMKNVNQFTTKCYVRRFRLAKSLLLRISAAASIYYMFVSIGIHKERHTAHTKCVCTQRIIMENCFHRHKQSCCVVGLRVAQSRIRTDTYDTYVRRWASNAWRNSIAILRRRPMSVCRRSTACGPDVGWLWPELRRRTPFSLDSFGRWNVRPCNREWLRGNETKWISGELSVECERIDCGRSSSSSSSQKWIAIFVEMVGNIQRQNHMCLSSEPASLASSFWPCARYSVLVHIPAKPTIRFAHVLRISKQINQLYTCVCVCTQQTGWYRAHGSNDCCVYVMPPPQPYANQPNTKERNTAVKRSR